MCLSLLCYPPLGMYFKLTESSSMITGRCGTWCTIHLRNEPACVISLSYGSIKHFIIKLYSKQHVSLKGKDKKYNMSECCMFYPLYDQIPVQHSYPSSYSTMYSYNIMKPQPQYKNRSKGNQRSICPSCNLSSFFSGMILYNMMLFLNYSLHVKWYQWIF